MALNFRIFAHKTRESLHLKLTGDFDGSSAHELLDTLEKYAGFFCQIFIDTSDLNTIYPFGSDVFQKKIGTYELRRRFDNLVFIGQHRHEIALG